MAKRYQRLIEDDISFYFAYDPDAPELLHIYARHLTRPEDVFAIWFDPTIEDEWNDEQQRFEVSNATHTLYWAWHIERESVRVISCFRR